MNQNSDNTTIDYIKQDNIGRIVARGIAQVFLKKPEFPIDYLGKWLLNYSISQENEKQILLREKEKEQMRQDHVNSIHQQEVLKEQSENQKRAEQQIDLDYDEKIKAHKYHEELLISDFPNFLEKRKNLTGCYFGYLDFPSKPIADEDDNEDAHLDNTQPKLLKYIGFSDSQQKILQRKTLQIDSGVTGDLFKDKEGGGDGGGAGEGGEEQQQQQQQDYGECIYVPDVVRNPRMFFFQIPRLGAYLAVPLFYNSCLNESSFDKGLEQRMEFLKQKAEQQAELDQKRADFERQIQDRENANEDTAELEEQWEQEKLNFQQLQEPPFPTVLRQFVACFDTLNQDREINEEDRQYLKEKIALFKESWETTEQAELNQDITKQIEYLEGINFQSQEMVDKLTLEEDEYIKDREDYLAEFKDKSEEEQFYEHDCVRLEKIQSQLQEPEIKKMLFMIKDFRVIKFPGLLQMFLYFIGYTKEEINIPKTNILNWKECKKLITEQQFLQKLLQYDHKGAKPEQIPDYAQLNRLSKRIEKYPQEEIDKYNLGLGRLYKMFQLTIKLRKANINLRRKQKQKQEQLRVEKLAEAEQREQKREQVLADKKQELQEKGDEEEIANFNEEEFLQIWDDENPEIEIPPEVEEDIDNDLESENQQQQQNE